MSSSRQFIVYGPDASLRGGLCDFAERTKKNLLEIMQQPDGWMTPIVVHAERSAALLPDGSPARLNLSQTGFGLKLQLDLVVGADAKVEVIGRELLRAVLLEMMYRDAPDISAGTPYVQPPDWLLEGVLALSPDRSSQLVAEAVAGLPSGSEVMPLPQFLEQKAAVLDSPSRAVFSTKAAAFIAMLTGSPAGQARLDHFIKSLPGGSDDSLGQVTSVFPELAGSPERVQTKWSAALARLASRDRYRMLNCRETEQALADALTLHFPSASGARVAYTLEEFPQFIRSGDAPRELQGLGKRLSLLSARANPLYAPLLAGYQRSAALLARRKTGKIAPRLAQLRGDREEISRRMSAIDDYINWFEGTQTRTQSGAFSEYMRAADLSEERRPRRHDPISVYLDAVESQLAD